MKDLGFGLGLEKNLAYITAYQRRVDQSNRK